MLLRWNLNILMISGDISWTVIKTDEIKLCIGLNNDIIKWPNKLKGWERKIL